MTAQANLQTETRTLVSERDINHPAEKVWRALTQPALMEEWLMKNDFAPVVGRKFQFRAEPMPQWDGIVNCEVLAVEPPKRLSFKWESNNGLKTVVTFTLTPTAKGVHLRMEQSGFRGAEDQGFYQGAQYGWQKMLGTLEQVAARL